jgi:hypothetical protein
MVTKMLRIAVPVLFVLGLVSGCAKPPEADIAAARASIEAARAAKADTYAVAELRAASDSLSALENELKVQEEKFALFRKYGVASRIASGAKMAGDKAAEAGRANEQKAKDESQQMMASMRTMLTEVETMLANAPRGKGAQADLEVLKADLARAGESLTAAQASWDAGKYLDAKRGAESAANLINRVKSDIENAMMVKSGGAAPPAHN